MASYNLDDSRAGLIGLAVGAGGGCLYIFTLLYLFSPLGDGPIWTEIPSQKAIKSHTTNILFYCFWLLFLSC